MDEDFRYCGKPAVYYYNDATGCEEHKLDLICIVEEHLKEKEIKPPSYVETS
jgi:hypothetical protein